MGIYISTTWINRGHFYVPHVMPVMVDCSFNVQPADSAGLGITQLKGQGVQNVFMHSTASFVGDTHTSTLVDAIASTASLRVGMPVFGSGITAGTTIAAIQSSVAITLSAATSSSVGGGTITFGGFGSNGLVNPNPNAGIIQVQLSDNFYKLYQCGASFHAPNGSASTSTVANVINVITVLGTATLAQWRAVGLPAGIAPAVGVSFVAVSSSLIGGSAQTAVVAAAGAGIDHIEHQGSADLAPIPVGGSPNFGGFLFLSCYKNTVLTAPATGTIVRLSFYMSQSGVVVSGE